MNPQRVLAYLDNAVVFMTKILPEFNAASHPCETCGLNVQEDYEEHRWEVEIRAARDKIVRLIAEIERKRATRE